MFNKYFVDVLKNHYMDFNGRASRKQFWMFVLWYFVISFVFAMLGTMDNMVGTIASVCSVLLIFAFFIPQLAIQVRRLHDIGLSGWWWFIGLVPFLGSIVLFVFFLLPSKK